MKKLILLLAISFIFIAKNSAQNNWIFNAATTTTVTTTYLENTNGADIIFGTGGTQQMVLKNSTGDFGIGTTFTPSHLLDVSGGDINVNTTARGYMIGGNYVLWHNGTASDIFVGVGAAGLAPFGIIRSTYVGYNAGNGVQTNDNTGIGYDALAVNTYGYDNTAVGGYALASQNFGFSGSPNSTDNTAVGWAALFSNNPSSSITGEGNTAIGAWAMYSNVLGPSNTAVGVDALNASINAGDNTVMGYRAMFNSVSGSDNVSIGIFNLLNNSSGSYNTSLGERGLQNNTTGSYNSCVGYEALSGNSSNTGSYNCALGNQADVSGSGLQYAVAIGASVTAAASHQMELGDNNEMVTLGMSTFAPTSTPVVTRLEINTANGSTPFTVSFNTASPVAASPSTGWSGLRFDNLTDASTTSTNPGTGVLALNSTGDVIYVTSPTGGTGIGYCSPYGLGPASLLHSGGYDLGANGANFYFAGNGSGSGTKTDVVIGKSCATPLAKLDVLQTSGANNTVGINVENDDVSSGTFSPFAPLPLIGIRSYIANSPYAAYSVAGWFQAAIIPGTTYWNYSLYVPQYGGQVCLGYQFSNHFLAAAYVVDINGAGRISAGIWAPSDTIIKKNVNYFKSGIKVIRQLNPVSFKFNGTGGFDTTGTHIGVIAENVARCAPYAVQYSTILKDTVTRDTANILNIYEEAILYTAVNAIKEVDSVNTVQQNTIDSLRTNLKNLTTSYDSVRSVFLSYLSCIKSLCSSSGGSGIRGPQNGNGDGTSNNNMDPALNTQDITLSASTGVPLLYQNMPNPFSSGTKINYYLPEGTMGASIIFYDTYGNTIKTVQLSQTGNGTLNITPDNLSNGIYSYSLIVNGAVIDTKKMLLQK